MMVNSTRLQDNQKPTTAMRYPGDMLPLTPVTLNVLISLMDEERHGLGVAQEVHLRSAGEVWLSASTLYPALKRLEAQGLIEESTWRPDPEKDDPRRRYYRLTEFGARVILAEVRRMEHYIHQVRSRFPSKYPSGYPVDTRRSSDQS